MLADRGFEVPVVLMTPQELSEVYDEACDFGGGKQLQGHYVSLLAEPPTEEGAKALEAGPSDGEEVRVGTRRAPDADHSRTTRPRPATPRWSGTRRGHHP